MADAKKKSTLLFTHWARPRVRTYEYNFEYGESYYRPLVRYISTSRALSSVSSSCISSAYETRQMRLQRRRRAYSPPGALSFIERWSYEPFYGYGIGFQSRDRSSRSSLSSISSIASERRALKSTKIANEFYNSFSRSARASSVASVSRVEESSAKYASDDCLMRSSSLCCSDNLGRIASTVEMVNASVASRRAAAASTNILSDRDLRAKSVEVQRSYLNYPTQHLVCPPNCPLHNNLEWRRRFLIGNRFLDAAALGGFDVLYDPTVYSSSRKLLSKLSERSEIESEDISIERSSAMDSSSRKIRCVSVM